MITKTSAFTTAPTAPGVTLRGYRGAADLPGMVEVINGSRAADKVDWLETLDGLQNTFAHLSNCDPRRDVLLAEADGRIVGYSRQYWNVLRAGGRVYVHYGFLLPRWRGLGVGSTMLRQHEGRALEIAAGHPQDGPRWLQSFANETETAKCGLLEGNGYEIARLFYDMVRPDLENIPAAPMPAGLEVRPVKPEHLRPIWDWIGEAFEDHWGEEVLDDEYFQRFIGSVEYDPEVWKVAWDIETNEVAGAVLGFIDRAENEAKNRQRGWTENIAVRRPWRRRGLARALMAENMRELKRRGMTEAALGVDTENRSGALGLYESMGFRAVTTERVYRKPLAG